MRLGLRFDTAETVFAPMAMVAGQNSLTSSPCDTAAPVVLASIDSNVHPADAVDEDAFDAVGQGNSVGKIRQPLVVRACPRATGKEQEPRHSFPLAIDVRESLFGRDRLGCLLRRFRRVTLGRPF